ncbi:MAG: Gfo/Idh/MocA family oxidoreductase [Cyclobacteriaceae bacterium]|nr:Gfo/Idh/MocA family oxidoreductase [Cyclobacteriaceae bacterium]
MKNYKVLIVGCGNMGASHAKAYHEMENCQIVGLVSRGKASRDKVNGLLNASYPEFSEFDEALNATNPDIVCISTYTETHVEYSIKSLRAGAHVFVEKPLAATVEEAQQVVDTARECGKKLIVGYILRVHPSWIKFLDKAREMGPPYVMRLNLNQQSEGYMWGVHKNLMNSISPLVDCGVHYVDVMCQVTGANPVSVNGMGVRLSDELNEGMYNYGHLQVMFDDGSVGWYEAGWGPMMSDTAYFVKDIIGKKGCVSMVDKPAGASSEIGGHTTTGGLKIHWQDRDDQDNFTRENEFIDNSGEPDHDALCFLEQEYMVKSIEEDLNLDEHQNSAIQSLAIVLAADESVRTGKTVFL